MRIAIHAECMGADPIRISIQVEYFSRCPFLVWYNLCISWPAWQLYDCLSESDQEVSPTDTLHTASFVKIFVNFMLHIASWISDFVNLMFCSLILTKHFWISDFVNFMSCSPLLCDLLSLKFCACTLFMTRASRFILPKILIKSFANPPPHPPPPFRNFSF